MFYILLLLIMLRTSFLQPTVLHQTVYSIKLYNYNVITLSWRSYLIIIIIIIKRDMSKVTKNKCFPVLDTHLWRKLQFNSICFVDSQIFNTKSQPFVVVCHDMFYCYCFDTAHVGYMPTLVVPRSRFIILWKFRAINCRFLFLSNSNSWRVYDW